MNPRQPVERMQTALQGLRRRWEQTRGLWQDPVQQDFAKAHLDPLDQEAQATLAEMQRLAETLAQAWRNAP